MPSIILCTIGNFNCFSRFFASICHDLFIEKVEHQYFCAHMLTLFSTDSDSFSAAQRHLYKEHLHVVGHQWLEDSLVKGTRLQEDSYSLKPEGLFEQR